MSGRRSPAQKVHSALTWGVVAWCLWLWVSEGTSLILAAVMGLVLYWLRPAPPDPN